MNLLFCSVGRRGELVKDFKESMGGQGKIVGADNSKYAPALYLTDVQYLVPRITDPDYINRLVDICKKEKIDAIATFIDPEIALLSANRDVFTNIGVQVLVPYENTAKLCFDKFEMYQFLRRHDIPTPLTFGDLPTFMEAMNRGEIRFPVFVKPRTGSGSVGARKIHDIRELSAAMENDPGLIIQELMEGVDLDADVYVDTISHQVVSAFSKKKISTTIGGANKTISFKDPELIRLIRRVVDVLELNGPNDMDFFYQNGTYYLSEINPRFGGAYLHAYGAGVDFIKLIANNVKGIANEECLDGYDEGVVMMMYDSVVIRRQDELAAE